jgi:hypothetical protein
MCPHSQWGTKLAADGLGKGTACTVNTRLAVADPKAPETPFLLRVPAGSRTNFSAAVQTADSHGKDYNEVVMRISFDQDAPSPKLIFKPNALLTDETFAKVEAMYDNQLVKDIVGVAVPRMAEEAEPAALPAPSKPAPPEPPERPTLVPGVPPPKTPPPPPMAVRPANVVSPPLLPALVESAPPAPTTTE